MDEEETVEDLLRRHAPQVLGALVRRYGHFDAAEDAVQEALLAAARQWPEAGTPANPRGWLIRVASRRLTDQLRADEARARREETAARLELRETRAAPSDDDTLTLLFLCCDPALAPAARIALTLRAVGASPRRRSPGPISYPRRRSRSGSAGRSRSSATTPSTLPARTTGTPAWPPSSRCST